MYNFEAAERDINIGRRMILAELYDQKIISKDIFEDYYHYHGIIVQKPSFFSNFWKKFYKEDEPVYILVKQKTLEVPKDDEPDGDKKAELKILNLDKDKKEK